MIRKLFSACCLVVATLCVTSVAGSALSTDRWQNQKPYGVFFNEYEPNFYTGFAPREQDRERITIHLGRGNQVRIRIVLSEEAIDNYLPDQVARHTLYKELIDKNVITLTTNTAWEEDHGRFVSEEVEDAANKKGDLSPQEWRDLNLQMMDTLMPGRLFHINKDFNQMSEDFAERLKQSGEPTTLEAKLDLVNAFFPHRLFLADLTENQDAALGELVALAKSDDMEAFNPKAQDFFHDITGHIYPIEDGRLDYYEFTSIYPVGTYDKTTTYEGRTIPQFTTTGVWWLIPRDHGKGYTGMVDYISSAGYYGLMPMLPYQYAGGIAYNAFHNPGISNWMPGHKLLPAEWKDRTEGSRNGKPFKRASITSRGPVSHGCTRLNSGHLAEFRELLPSTSEDMKGIVAYMNLSHCYDVIDLKGDGNVQAMGVQYYLAFRHTKSRVAKQIWVQNNREDYYNWLYGDEITYGPVGEVLVKEAYDCKFVKRKAVQGERYENIPLYEAPYEPEQLQFFKINNVDSYSKTGMDFNRELRRVGHGYTIDRKTLLLE